MLVNGSGRNEQSLQRIFHRCFLPSFGSFGQAVSEEKFFKNLYKRKMHFEYRYLYINKSYVSFHRRYFRNQPIRNKNCLWRPCLLMVRDEMSSLYRGPSIDASYQISVHLGKRFQRRRFFRNQPIRNKNGLWQPCLLTDRDEISNLYRGPSMDASYQVSVHLGKRF